MIRNERTHGMIAGSILGAGVVGTLLAASHPVEAAGVLAAVASAVTCAATGTAACVSGANTSSGIGVLGTSNTGTGVRASSNTNYGVKGTSGSSYGVYGQATTGAAGVFGTSKSYGVSGQATSNGTAGVFGTSNNYGVYGYVTGGTGTLGLAGQSGSGTGVYGTTATGNGYGVVGAQGDTGVGVLGTSVNGTGGSFASTNGNAGDFRGNYLGVVARAKAGGFPFAALDYLGNTLFSVDASGNVSYKGSLISFARSAAGGTLRAFSSKTTSPTVEDVGTAQLVGGSAAVRLDPSFAASIDPAAGYRVFLTPNGDTHGLFVPTKTPSGFVDKESQGGRSTTTFDYRIVATSFGEAGLRMAPASAASIPRTPLPGSPVGPSAIPPRPLAPPPPEQ